MEIEQHGNDHKPLKLYRQYKFMIYIRIREVMDSYRRRTGVRLTYETIAEMSGISVATLQSLAARPGYNTTLSTIEKLCTIFGCEPGELLELRAPCELDSPREE